MKDELKKEVSYAGIQSLISEKEILASYASLIDKVGELCADTGGALPIAVSIVFAEPGPNNTSLFSAKTVTRKKDSEKRLQDIMDKAIKEWIQKEFGDYVEVAAEPWEKQLN